MKTNYDIKLDYHKETGISATNLEASIVNDVYGRAVLNYISWLEDKIIKNHEKESI